MTLLVVCFVGVLLISSALPKFRAPDMFMEIVANYPFLIPLDARFLIYGIPLFELVVGLALLSFAEIPTLLALLAALCFFALVTTAIVFRRVRGEKRFRCGCGSNLLEQSSATWLLVRNSCLIAAVLTALVADIEFSSITWWQASLTVLNAASLVLVLNLTEAMVRANEWIRQWKVSGSSRTLSSGG